MKEDNEVKGERRKKREELKEIDGRRDDKERRKERKMEGVKRGKAG